MGMSPQTGLPQNNRVGDFDAYALPMLAERMGKTVDDVLAEMAKRGGLLGFSGTSGDIRDLYEAARPRRRAGPTGPRCVHQRHPPLRRRLHRRARRRRCDRLHRRHRREPRGDSRRRVCRARRARHRHRRRPKCRSAAAKASIHADSSRTQIWIVPTNEELVVARQAKELLEVSN